MLMAPRARRVEAGENFEAQNTRRAGYGRFYSEESSDASRRCGPSLRSWGTGPRDSELAARGTVARSARSLANSESRKRASMVASRERNFVPGTVFIFLFRLGWGSEP